MDKTEFIENLHQDLMRDPALLHACESVVDYLSRVTSDEWRHITFGMLSRIAGLSEPVDAVPIAQYLSSSRVRLLQRCFLLITGGEEFEMEDDVVEEAFRTRILYHPDKGEPVNDFEKLLHIYFIVSEQGKGVLQGKAS
ncbi:hypothetical protein [Comamonas thiooxydans]|uniref:hypothetical protein n=1 Tax=Comamonas thiooxydans TaxID=363952 RepID=UPI000579F9FC|nr:hypothetical protein [Comamonas thiooxydans]